MKILVLGGSGFFGKSFVDYFQKNIFNQNESKYTLILASRNIESVKNIIDSKLLNKKIYLDSIDVTSCSSIPDADLVIHAATSTSEEDYINNPEFEKNNIIKGAENIIKKIKRDTNFMYISSGAVYGKHLDKNNSFLEDEKNKIVMLDGTKLHYANAKIKAENTIIKYSKLNSVKSTIARCYAFVGKHLPLDSHFYIGNMINSILNEKEHHIKSEHQVFRSYMHADDLVRSLLFINSYSSTNCEIFNIGSNEVAELHELAQFFSNNYKFKISGNIKANKKLNSDIYVPNIDKLLSKGFKLNYNMTHSIKNVIKQLKNE
jgi:dTDP-glucose 4,6-dehydratase